MGKRSRKYGAHKYQHVKKSREERLEILGDICKQVDNLLPTLKKQSPQQLVTFCKFSFSYETGKYNPHGWVIGFSFDGTQLHAVRSLTFLQHHSNMSKELHKSFLNRCHSFSTGSVEKLVKHIEQVELEILLLSL